MTQMIHQTHTDIQVWNVRCEVQPGSAFSALHGDIDTLFSFITRSCGGRTGIARLTCIEGFFTDAVVRHLAPCISRDLKGCVVWGCDHEFVAGFDVMFVCRLSVFEELQQRPPKCVCDCDEPRGTARLRSSNPNAFPPPCSPHPLHPLPRHVFSLSHTARDFLTEDLFFLLIVRLRARLGYVTPRFRLFCFFKHVLLRTVFSLPFSFLIHVEHNVMALQDQRSAATTNGKGHQGHEAA